MRHALTIAVVLALLLAPVMCKRNVDTLTSTPAQEPKPPAKSKVDEETR